MKRGEIWWADVGSYRGHEQGGYRPVLILQNDIGNKEAPTTIVAMLTGADKTSLPTHVMIDRHEANLRLNSTIMLEQLATIDKSFLRYHVCNLSIKKMQEVDAAIKISLGV